MIPRHSAIAIILVLCAVVHATTGKYIVVRRSADDTDSENDNDNDSDDGNGKDIMDITKDILDGIMVGLDGNGSADVFAEAMKNINEEINQYIEQVPKDDKEETIEVNTIDGYDVKTRKTVIDGALGGKDAELHIEQTKVLGKHESEENDGEDESAQSSVTVV